MELGEKLFGSRWFKEQVEKEVKKDSLPSSERFGQLIGVVATLIVIAFFAIHQTRPTGFFTDDFRALEAALLYTVLVFGLFPMLARFITGRRNEARLLDAIDMVIFLVAGLYLLIVFPFDFSHFAEPLPRSLEFLLDWISATLAKWVIGIGIVASAFFSIYTFALHASVRKRLMSVGAVPQKAEQ